MESAVWSDVALCNGVQEAGKGKEVDSPLKPPEGMQPH